MHIQDESFSTGDLRSSAANSWARAADVSANRKTNLFVGSLTDRFSTGFCRSKLDRATLTGTEFWLWRVSQKNAFHKTRNQRQLIQ